MRGGKLARPALAAWLVLAGLTGLTGLAQAGDQDFLLVNKTGKVIDALYVVPNHARTWEEDILGRDVLLNGESTTIRFSREERDCVWDLLVVDQHGEEMWWEDIDLCKYRRVILTIERDEPVAYYD
ncbi:MAG: hypothetical protein LDL11_06355 [Desulfarculus sp.]|nr:hypothetical protein [Desulfarculus sp.]